MSNHQLHPLELNPRTGELCLRLRKHSNIILTPPRLTDAPLLVPYMNDPLVHVWLSSPPYPYLLEHAIAWVTRVKNVCDATLKELQAASDTDAVKVLDNCPVRYIREVQEDGSEILIGDIGLIRCPYGEFLGTDGIDWLHKEQRLEENNSLRAGDPNIVWSIGDFLAPSHHRRGIMTDAVETLLYDWGVPRMGVQQVLLNVIIGNEGSTKVFLKNGFKLTRTYEDYVDTKGIKRGVHVLEWKLN